jgi:hypothetical protein
MDVGTDVISQRLQSLLKAHPMLRMIPDKQLPSVLHDEDIREELGDEIARPPDKSVPLLVAKMVRRVSTGKISAGGA